MKVLLTKYVESTTYLFILRLFQRQSYQPLSSNSHVPVDFEIILDGGLRSHASSYVCGTGGGGGEKSGGPGLESELLDDLLSDFTGERGASLVGDFGPKPPARDKRSSNWTLSHGDS